MMEKHIAIALMGIFYAAYLGKKYVQGRQGITTNQIGKGAKPRKVLHLAKRPPSSCHILQNQCRFLQVITLETNHHSLFFV